MRIGIFIGDAAGGRTDIPDLLARARRADELGFATGWFPHIPWSLDALVAVGNRQFGHTRHTGRKSGRHDEGGC